MLFKLRRVRRSSRFSSRMRTTSRQRREYAATVYSMAVIQAVLAVTLFVAGVKAWQAVSAHGSDLPLAMKLALPIVFTGGALLAARAAVGSVRSAREMRLSRPKDEARDRDHPPND